MTIAAYPHQQVRPISPVRAPTFIDLFAGCGGLSLGLELAGFQPVFVNELHPDAMETYLVNRRQAHPELDRYKAHDIHEVTKSKDVLDGLVNEIKVTRGLGDIDLVAGGPPCQGYSGIGHRRTFTGVTKLDIPSNHLYVEMAKFIDAARPKLFVFENVKGLISSRWTPHGKPGEIWEDVRRTFESLDGYDVRHAVVHAKAYGVPQNRPRVLLVGIRRDLAWSPRPDQAGDGLLPPPTGIAPDPIDFLGDLLDPDFVSKTATIAYPQPAVTPYQVWYRTDRLGQTISGRGDPVSEHEYSRHQPRIVEKFRYMIETGGEIRPQDQTRKFAQRVIPARWNQEGPSITATSLPDDYVHFSQPRILTVREWARFQTFPDWYQFAGKRTTGGRRRAGDPGAGDWSREVPKYTQIGNAVPVRLAEALGRHLRTFVR